MRFSNHHKYFILLLKILKVLSIILVNYSLLDCHIQFCRTQPFQKTFFEKGIVETQKIPEKKREE